MKDFLDYLKSTRWIVVLSAPLYFLFVQAYVYPTLSFDFSVASRFSTWIELLFMEAWLAMIFYFVFWRPTQKTLKKEKSRQ